MCAFRFPVGFVFACGFLCLLVAVCLSDSHLSCRGSPRCPSYQPCQWPRRHRRHHPKGADQLPKHSRHCKFNTNTPRDSNRRRCHQAVPGGAAPTTPEWLRHTNPATLRKDTATCTVCLFPINPGATGPEMLFPWPNCSHPLHLGCAAHYRAHTQQPRCPAAPMVRDSGDPTSGQMRTTLCRHACARHKQANPCHWAPASATTRGHHSTLLPSPFPSRAGGTDLIRRLARTTRQTHAMGPNARPLNRHMDT